VGYPRPRQLSTIPLSDRETGVPVHALNAFVIVAPALAPQLPRQQRRAPPWMIAGQLLQALPQWAVVASWHGDVAHRGPMHAKPAAGAALTDRGALLDIGDRTAPPLGSHQSFPATSLST
jgi:hypothetical protein